MDLSQVSTEDLLAQHYGGMDKVPTDVLMRAHQAAQTPVAAGALSRQGRPAGVGPGESSMMDTLATIGKGGKWLNDKIQAAIGAGVDKTAQTFGQGAGNVAAAVGTIPATASEFFTPKDASGVAAMLMPMPTGAGSMEAITGPAGAAARGLGGLAEGTLEQASKLYSKTSPQAFEMLRQDPQGVLAAARKGMGLNSLTQASEPIALADAQAAGRTAQGVIDESAKGAGKEYGAMMDHLHEDVSGTKFDVAGKVYDTMEPYIRNQGASLRKPVGANAEAGAKRIMDIYGEIKNSATEGLTPGDAADKLQELTAIQRGIPEMSPHAAALKDALLESLPGEYKMPTIDTPTQEGWSIQDTRSNYAAAKGLQRELKPFTNPQNPIAALRSVARAGGDASVSLKNAIDKIPALKAAIERMNLNAAGAEFAPKFKTPPGTGLTGAAGLLATKLIGGNVAALPATAISAVGMSPRLTAETLVAGRRAGSALMNSARGAEGRLPALLATILRRKQSGQQP